MSRRYTEDEKQRALDALRQNRGDIDKTSAELGIPARTLRNWQRLAHKWDADHAADHMRHAQRLLAERTVALVEAISAEKINSAPINQLASAIGTFIDRYLKLDEHLNTGQEEEQEQVIRFEFQYPDGSIHSTPQWANDDYAGAESLSGSGLRATLRQDGNGQTAADRARLVPEEAVLVAGTDVPDGEPGLARSENRYYDDERAWYHD